MRLRFIEQRVIGGGVATFVFEPLELVSWIAGQSIRLEIPAPDYGTNERRFTISAAPFEGVIAITTRRSESEFKQSLFALQPGDVIDGYGIEGDFIWGDAVSPVFVAGGIGITPFYSMLKQRVHEGLPLDATLLYGSTKELPFKEELQGWAAEYPLEVSFYQKPVTSVELQEIGGLTDKIIFLSGAEAYVKALKNSLMHDLRLSEEQIRTDQFTGSTPV